MDEKDRAVQRAPKAASAYAQPALKGMAKTSHALQETERRYRELVEYSLGLICTHDLNGTILSINPAAARSLEYEAEDGIGRNLREFLAPDKRPLFDDYLLRVREQGHDAGLMSVVSRSGAIRVWMYRNVLSRGSDNVPYVLGHAIDITDRVTAERTLRENEKALLAARSDLEARVKERTIALEMANERQQETLAFLSTLSDRLAPVLTFEHLLDVVRQIPIPSLADWTMVHLVEPDGAVQCLPGVHVDMHRYAESLATLSTLSSGPVLGTSHLAGVMATGLTTIVSSRRNPVAPLMTGLDHSVGIFDHLGMGSVAMIPLVVDDKVKAILSLVSRDADRFASATALIVDQVARALDLTLRRIRLFREAEEANRLKDEFLSTLSHELRTPLNAIFGWARILRRRQLDDAAAHAVEVIERNAELQIRLIEEVLDVSRIIAGKMTLAREPVDTAAILRTTIDTSRPTISAKQIRLEEHISDNLPGIAADPHRLQQVFSNLLSNALKFTPDRGAIRVTLHKAGGVLRFEITDTGIGIRREVLPFVFDRFRQGDSSTTRHHGGLGLGLAIVRHIVEQHGGKIEASSGGEGHGTTVTVVIPVDEGADALRRWSSSAGASDDVSKTLRDATILVVEDHADARELIVGMLESAGAHVLLAATTHEALQRAKETKPDVLLADLGLPGEDGFALLRYFRAIHPGVPALALTAYARATDRERALGAGFQDHIVKPIDPFRLVQIVAAHV